MHNEFLNNYTSLPDELEQQLNELTSTTTAHNEQHSQAGSTIHGFDNEIKQREQQTSQTEQTINRTAFKQQKELDRVWTAKRTR